MLNRPGLLDIERTDGQNSVNVSQTERIISAVAVPLIAYTGAKRGGPLGFLLGVVAAELAVRSVTGHSPLYNVLGINTAVEHQHTEISVPSESGFHIEENVYIARPKTELYAFWRNFSNLPRIMPYLKSVKEMGDYYSHWVAKGPLGLLQLEWDAEITSDEKNDLIAWRTLPGSQITHSGSVRFETTPDTLGTVVTVEMDYIAPGGTPGNRLASLLGAAPAREIDECLDSLKTLMETGIAPKTKSKKSFAGNKPLEEVPVESRRREIERRADYVQMTSEDSFPASDPPASW
jgi:uncharacterized membrane protein